MPSSKRQSQPNLRRRSPDKQDADPPKAEAPAPTFVHSPPATRSRYQFGRSRLPLGILLASFLVSAFVLLRDRLPGSPPNAYALCSRIGADIYTVDTANPRVQCLFVQDSHFIHTGSLEEVQARWKHGANSTLSHRLQVRYIEPGQIVVPGLSDSHAHILEYGATRLLPLEGTSTIEETVERVKYHILSDPELRHNKSLYVEGTGWDHTKWFSGTWPTYEDLQKDPVLRDRPIVLQSKDLHALWVSENVLKQMAPLPDTVPGGSIIRDDSGKPTGVFLDSAQDLVVRPPPTIARLRKLFEATVTDALAAGLTSIHDAALEPTSLEFFRKAAEAGKLPLRIYGMSFFDEEVEYWGNTTEKLIGVGNRLTVRSVKIFADGALRSGGAALYEPYTDNPSTSGFMRISPETLKAVIPSFMRDGWQLNVHAIGDRANGIVLDAFEAALAEANVSALRPRLEHAQILDKRDMTRFGDLGVIASIQPTHATSDMWFGEERLGPERVKGLYAFRSILDHGARITLGSDFPVDSVNPLAGFYAAITRLSPEGTSPHGPGGWFPEQRMTREEALKGMTIDPAYASFSDNILGSITPGKHADFVVLSQDIMSIPPPEILNTKVIATVIDGKPAYGTF